MSATQSEACEAFRAIETSVAVLKGAVGFMLALLVAIFFMMIDVLLRHRPDHDPLPPLRHGRHARRH